MHDADEPLPAGPLTCALLLQRAKGVERATCHLGGRTLCVRSIINTSVKSHGMPPRHQHPKALHSSAVIVAGARPAAASAPRFVQL